MQYTKNQIENLFVGIYNGDIDPLELPEDLYLAIAEYLNGGVIKGFGGVEFGSIDKELIANLKENIYLFSAAKTFQQTLEMSDAMVDEEGKLLPFDEFKMAAKEIFTRYNGGEIEDEVKPGWLEAEYNTAIAQAGHAAKWDKIEKEKESLPYLIRNEVDDSVECDICASVNGVCLPVDHPFWDENGGELHFNCRGIVEQADKEEGEKFEWSEEEVEEANQNSKEAGRPDEFKFNPGKKGEVFSTEGKSQHPYFSVPKEYKEFAQYNFNLKIPEE